MSGTDRGVPVDSRLRAAERLWIVGDATGLWMLTHVGKYQGEVVADNILGHPREADYKAVPRVVYTGPQAAAVGAGEGAGEGPFSARVPISEVAKTAAYTRAYADTVGFVTLLSDGPDGNRRLRAGSGGGGVAAAGDPGRPRAQVPLDVLRDTIQPFPTFSEIYVAALNDLHHQVTQGSAVDGRVPA